MKNKESVRFNLTDKMSLELIKFNKLKKELLRLKKLYNLDKNKNLLLKITIIEKEMNESRKRFIKEFRNSNYNEIIEYLKLKDQEK